MRRFISKYRALRLAARYARREGYRPVLGKSRRLFYADQSYLAVIVAYVRGLEDAGLIDE